MKLLLDSHCLIWVLTDAPRLNETARQLISDADGVWFSHASIWEFGLKWRKGKIASEPRHIAEQALQNGLRSLPIDLESLLVSSKLRHAHGDPFDRLLYAQAKAGGYRLLSIDRTLASFGSVVLHPDKL